MEEDKAKVTGVPRPKYSKSMYYSRWGRKDDRKYWYDFYHTCKARRIDMNSLIKDKIINDELDKVVYEISAKLNWRGTHDAICLRLCKMVEFNNQLTFRQEKLLKTLCRRTDCKGGYDSIMKLFPGTTPESLAKYHKEYKMIKKNRIVPK